MKTCGCLPCSNPCDSCFSLAPETPAALPQPGTQTCKQVQKINTQCTSACYSSALLHVWTWALYVYFHPVRLKVPQYSDSPLVHQHYSIAEVCASLSSDADGVPLVLFSSRCLFTRPYQASKKCTLTEDFKLGSSEKLSFRATAHFNSSHSDQGDVATL